MASSSLARAQVALYRLTPSQKDRISEPYVSAAGKMARQTSGADAVEVKATIEDDDIRASLKDLSLDPKKAVTRFVYFFDTPRLDLFRSGVIVRARRTPGESHDSTIKIRPVRAGQVPAKWHKEKGFKLEADAGESGIVRSASLSNPVAKGLIKDVSAGKTPLSALFGEAQKLFLAEMCRIRYDLDKLALLGPIEVLWWKIVHPGVPVPMTAELWTREDKKAMLEASIRVPASQAAFANAGFNAFLAEFGAERDNAQQAKTRWALEFCAAHAPVRAKEPSKSEGKKPGKKKSAGKKAGAGPAAKRAKAAVAAPKPRAENAVPKRAKTSSKPRSRARPAPASKPMPAVHGGPADAPPAVPASAAPPRIVN